MELQITTRPEQLEDGTAAADLDVVRVSSETQDSKVIASVFRKVKWKHGQLEAVFPDLPGCVALGVQVIQVLLIFESIHGSPKTAVAIG